MLKKSSIALAIAGTLGVTSFNSYADGVPGGSMQNNPAFNVVMEGRYVDQDEAHFSLPGFQGADAFDHLGTFENGFSAGHNEINMGGTVTEDTSGVISFAVENHDGESSIDLEEAYVETTALGNGVTVKAGQFYSHIGLLNTKHEHRQDFANASLVYIGMFAGHLSNTGVQLRYEQAGDIGFAVGVEASTGADYPGGHNEDNNGGLTLFAKASGDIGSKSSWSAGVSSYSSDFDARHTGGHHAGGGEEFEIEAGSVKVTGVDLEYVFSPNGKGESGELKISMEYYMRDEDGEAMFTDALGEVASADYDGEQSGYYVAAVYRFMPKWRVGLRFDHLESDNSFSNYDGDVDANTTSILLADFEDESRLISDREPERTTLMVDYAPNHNTTLRAQYMQDDVGAETEDRIYLQYIVAIGGHGH